MKPPSIGMDIAFGYKTPLTCDITILVNKYSSIFCCLLGYKMAT